jgi:hypothetical protein
MERGRDRGRGGREGGRKEKRKIRSNSLLTDGQQNSKLPWKNVGCSQSKVTYLNVII